MWMISNSKRAEKKLANKDSFYWVGLKVGAYFAV